MAIHLFLGGARSGKSAAAHLLALQTSACPVYVATSAVEDDEEFAARVARHRADRTESWTTVEEPLDLVGALAAHAGEGTAIVVDCLTLWLTNLMAADADVDAATVALCDALATHVGTVALVSNEVGQGIVPMHPMTRAFRDHQGRINQRVAATADHVSLLVAGIPLTVKG